MGVQRDILITFCSWAKEVGYIDGESDVEDLVDYFFAHSSNDNNFSYNVDKSDMERARELKRQGLL